MKLRWIVRWVVLTLVLSPAVRSFAASGSDAALGGVVRDAHGVPQMGTLVQLLSADATVIATAFTDSGGRYRMPSVVPGQYQLRATAAFFMPTSRRNIHLEAGAQAIINLTMSTLYEAETWLPAQKRGVDEASDDWKWVLRSPSNRPLLRLVDQGENTAEASSSAEHPHHAATQARVSVFSGDGDFGHGGTHQILVLERSLENGETAILRADAGGPRTPYPVLPAAEVTAGYQRRSLFAGTTRLIGSFSSHPELTSADSAGAQIIQFASARQMHFGDLLVIDAGSLTRASHLRRSMLQNEPFARIALHPGDSVVVEYRYAAGRELQSADDLDTLRPSLNILSTADGVPVSTGGGHHEAALHAKIASRLLTIAAYTEHNHHTALHGSGLLTRADLLALPVLSDATTGTFALAGTGYRAHGAGVVLVQPLTGALALQLSYDLGTVLTSQPGAAEALTALAQSATTRVSYAAAAAVHGKIVRTGTALQAQYRWQPERNLTAVNAWNTPDNAAYLGFRLRQRLYLGRLLPQGLDAVVQASNLLEQGYQPVVAADGHVLFLAQTPRAVQGGFAFNF